MGTNYEIYLGACLEFNHDKVAEKMTDDEWEELFESGLSFFTIEKDGKNKHFLIPSFHRKKEFDCWIIFTGDYQYLEDSEADLYEVHRKMTGLIANFKKQWDKYIKKFQLIDSKSNVKISFLTCYV